MAEGKRSSSIGADTRIRWVKALSDPFNLVLLVGVVLAGIVAGAPLALSVGLALLVYAAGVVRKVLEDREPDREAAAHRPARREPAGKTTIAIEDLTPEIRAEVEDVQRRARRIETAIDDAEHPYEDARTELAGFVQESERSAQAAQMLQRRLSRPLRDRPDAVQRIESQLAGYHSEIERLCAQLGAVWEDQLSDSAMTPDERSLAAELRALREEMGALAVGVEHAYEEAPA